MHTVRTLFPLLLFGTYPFTHIVEGYFIAAGITVHIVTSVPVKHTGWYVKIDNKNPWHHNHIKQNKTEPFADWTGYAAYYILNALFILFSDIDGGKRNDRHFAEDIFKFIFLNASYILIHIAPKFISKGPIDNTFVFIQVMARRNMRQAITSTNVGSAMWLHIVSLGKNEFWNYKP